MKFLSEEKDKSYFYILLISAIFFAGYFLLKCPLAFVLHKQGIPLLKAYSITTTANILMAVVSVALGIFLRDNPQQKFLLFLGVLLSSLALLFLNAPHFWVLLVGVSLYVLGGSLYFFNIIIYINKLFTENKDRQLGNYQYQIWINAGGFIGGLLFILEYNDSTKLNEYSFFACLLSLFLFLGVYKKMRNQDLNYSALWSLSTKFIFLFALIFICLYYDFVTRWTALFIFFLATAYGVYHAQKTGNQNYLTLILFVLFFSVPYWLGYTILYNEFFHLLDQNTYRFFGITSNSLILIDPLANVFFGFLVLRLYQKYTYTMQTDLTFGMLLLSISFLVLCFGILISKSPREILPFYPALTVFLFSCGEFLIQSTLNASVRNLLTQGENISFGMGILRSSRASASALGYFFMWLTVRHHLNQKDLIPHQELNLYLLTALYIFASLLIFLYVKKTRTPSR